VYNRFSRWAKNGVWQDIFDTFGKDADMEWLLIDSTIIRAHQHAAGAKGGKKIRR
jgi:transposase